MFREHQSQHETCVPPLANKYFGHTFLRCVPKLQRIFGEILSRVEKPEFTSTAFNWPLTARVPGGYSAGPSP